MQEDLEAVGRVLRPVEEEAGDGHWGLAGEVYGEGLDLIGEVGLPLRAAGAVDGGNGELAWLEGVGGRDRVALGDVAFDGDVGGDVAIGEGEGAVWPEVVDIFTTVADLNGDGAVGEGLVGG